MVLARPAKIARNSSEIEVVAPKSRLLAAARAAITILSRPAC